MSGDLQAKRKGKNRSKKKIHDLEKREHFGEALQAFGDEGEDSPPSGGINKARCFKILFFNLFEKKIIKHFEQIIVKKILYLDSIKYAKCGKC